MQVCRLKPKWVDRDGDTGEQSRSAVNAFLSFPLGLLWHAVIFGEYNSPERISGPRGAISPTVIISGRRDLNLVFRVSVRAQTSIRGAKTNHVSVWATFPGTDSKEFTTG